MKLPIFTALTFVALSCSLLAQAPDGWKRTKEKTAIEANGDSIIQYGEWTSSDETRTAIAVSTGQPKTAKDLAETGAGMMSGVIRSGVMPLKFEARKELHPMLIVRGQVEFEGGEYFQDTYVILTQKGLFVLKVSGLEEEVPFAVDKWDLGEPVKDEDGSFSDQMEKLAKDLNKGLPRLQDLVKNAREASEKP